MRSSGIVCGDASTERWSCWESSWSIPRPGCPSVSGFVDAYSAVDRHVPLARAERAVRDSADRDADRAAARSGWKAPTGPRRSPPWTARARRWMGRFTSFGTPIAVNIMSGIVASAFVVLRLPGHERQAGQLLRGDALADGVDDGGQLRLHLPGAGAAAASCTRTRAAPTECPAGWPEPGSRRSSPRPTAQARRGRNARRVAPRRLPPDQASAGADPDALHAATGPHR